MYALISTLSLSARVVYGLGSRFCGVLAIDLQSYSPGLLATQDCISWVMLPLLVVVPRFTNTHLPMLPPIRWWLQKVSLRTALPLKTICQHLPFKPTVACGHPPRRWVPESSVTTAMPTSNASVPLRVGLEIPGPSEDSPGAH